MPEAKSTTESSEEAASHGARGVFRDALSGRSHDLTGGRLGRSILLLAIPMILEMAMESVFAIVDVFFVGRLGENAIATVGLTESVLILFYAVAIGLSMSSTAIVSRRVGEKDLESAARSGFQAIALAAVVAIGLGIPCAVFAPSILGLMGGSDALIAEGSGYAGVLLGTNVVIMLLFVNNAVVRGAGDAVIAMRALWIANGINIVLDPCLIFGLGPFPELGLTGAAVATTCGRGIGVLYQFRALSRGSSRIHLKRSLCRLDGGAMLSLLRLSAGSISQFAVDTASWLLLIRIVSSFGSVALAGYTIGLRIVMFVFLPSWGFSNAAATLMGQNLGAGQPDRAAKAVWTTGLINMAFLFSVALVFFFASETLVSLFSEKEGVIAHGADFLEIMACGFAFFAWGLVMTQAFNGAGDPMTPTWINLVCHWGIQLPLAWALAVPMGWGPAGVFWGATIAHSLHAVVSIVVFRRGRWRHRKV